MAPVIDDSLNLGPRGDPGLSIQGEPGKPGLPGPTGASGGAGDTGATGMTGERGDTGLQGAPGITGPQGPSGLKGDMGPAYHGKVKALDPHWQIDTSSYALVETPTSDGGPGHLVS